MPKNIEVKAHLVGGIHNARKIAAKVAKFTGILKQNDTFFNAPTGHLKLREENESATLIAYERGDVLKGAEETVKNEDLEKALMQSDYKLTPVNDASSMKQVLEKCMGVKGNVRKDRELYIAQNDDGITARIHLDKVEGLGEYIEFEVLIEEDYGEEAKPQLMAQYLMETFGIQDEHVIHVPYMSMLTVVNETT